jgi:hypothetical protein
LNPKLKLKMGDEFFGRPNWAGDLAKWFRNAPVEEAVRAQQDLEDVLRGMGGGLEEGALNNLINQIQAGRGDPRQFANRDVIRDIRDIMGRLGVGQDITRNNINDVINVGGQILQDIADIRGLLGGEARAARDEKQQERAPDPNIDDGLGGLLGDVLGGLMDAAGVPDDQKDIIRGIVDVNKDGRVDKAEAKALFDDDSAINKIASLSPAVARMLREPNFRMRTIEKIDAPTIGGKNPRDKFEQVSLVQQGYANYDLAENMFNVNF